MIPRYSHPEMTSIWSDESKYAIWLHVETLALEKMVDLGLAPRESLDAVRSSAKYDIARVSEIEAEVKHDVIAFLTNVAEHVGPLSRYVHRGMTSSDLLDTAFAVQLKRSGELILTHIDTLLATLEKRAHEFKMTPCIGRSHGIHAEPTTFGLKLIGWYAEVKRAKARIVSAVKEVSVAKISGAVGTFAQLPPSVEQYVAERLELTPDTVSTQVVPRDRHASFFAALALLATSIERFVTEIRHLQRTEVAEVEEKFTAGQKGSSAMPHKRNPIHSENITGLARLIRGYVTPALENIPLWHERDISHSSVERVIAPDACTAMDFILRRVSGLIENLVVYPENMKRNLESSRSLYFSGTLLVAMVDSGVTREDAYSLVQKHAMEAWEKKEDFPTKVRRDPEFLKALGEAKLNEIFDPKNHFKYVDFIFERALKS